MNDFNNLKESGIRYGGNAGNKLGVIINDENWFLKFPKSTKDLIRKTDISYTTSPLSEYIGSQIYKTIGIPVHDTMLGIKNNKVVVACKDFRKNQSDYRFDDFNSIKNDYVEGLEEKLESTSSTNLNTINLEEIMIIMEHNPLFIKMPELENRFWDMFIVDALIGNNDRNNGNWGVIVNNKTRETKIAPVFDNGSSFNTKSSDEQIEKIINDKERFISSAYKTRLCIFSLNNKQINPFEYIESMENEKCNKALLRIIPKIDLEKIKDIIYKIPNNFEGIEVISDIRKDFYYKSIEYRYYNSLLETYNKLLDK